MRISPVVLLCPMVLGWSRGPVQQPAGAPWRLELERFTDSMVAEYLRQSSAPSLAVVVTTGKGIVFEKGYGLEGLPGRAAVDPTSTLFNIASVSKLFVATAVMQLVDLGKLRLGDRVDRYLPGARLEGSAGPVTIRHLLTHTSGIDAPFMRGTVPRPEQVVPLATYFARFRPRLGREPGGEIRYSNEGMALAALIVEQVSGERFDRYAERHIFGPLGMRRSSFRQPPPLELSARVATAGSGAVPNALILYPVGSMVSTVSDVARFMGAQLNGGMFEGTRILSGESARAMQTTQWTAHPGAPGVGLGFFESDLGGQRGLFHTGARVHFSLLYLLPERDLGIFLVHSTRQGGPFQPLRTAYVRGLVERFFPGDSGASGAGDSAGRVLRARGRAGVYRPVLLSSSTIEKAALLGADTRVRAISDGSLEVALPAGETVRAVEQASGVYRALDGPHAGVVFAFTGASGSSRARMSLSGGTQDPVSFDRVRWYERGTLHAMILAAGLGLLTTFCLVAGVRGLVLAGRRRSRGPPGDRESGDAARAWRAATVASAVVLSAPLIGAVVLAASQSEAAAADALRRALAIALWLLTLGALLATRIPWFAVRAWRRRWWSTSRRVYYTILAVAVTSSLPLLAYYRLLGAWL